jgi:hypothetical protein
MLKNRQVGSVAMEAVAMIARVHVVRLQIRQLQCQFLVL